MNETQTYYVNELGGLRNLFHLSIKPCLEARNLLRLRMPSRKSAHRLAAGVILFFIISGLRKDFLDHEFEIHRYSQKMYTDFWGALGPPSPPLHSMPLRPSDVSFIRRSDERRGSVNGSSQPKRC